MIKLLLRRRVLDPADDPKVKKKFEAWLQKERAKPTAKEVAELKELEGLAVRLWRKVVVQRAGHKCEVPSCKKTKFLNAHHIENFSVNKYLRTDPENGLCLCPSHHKFNRLAAHKSFCFMCWMMGEFRQASHAYLMRNFTTKKAVTKEFLEARIQSLTHELEGE